MTFPRFNKKNKQSKNKNALKRLEKCAQRNSYQQQMSTPPPNSAQPNALSVKDVENIILDLALSATYNHGDKQDVLFVQDVLTPNNIHIPEGVAMESFWDKVTNSGLVKPTIGFGNADKISITPKGYELMEQFGNYQTFLLAQQQHIAQQVITQANNNEVDIKEVDEIEKHPIPKPTKPEPPKKHEDNNVNFE